MSEKNKDTRALIFAFVAVLTIIVAITGATFAYFQATVSNNNAIKGNSGYVANPLSLTVTEQSAVQSANKKLVPQLDAAVRNAANGTNKCIDGNGNAVCEHYSITIKNDTTNTYFLDGTLTLTAASMGNLKWSVCSGLWTCTSNNYYTKSSTSLGSTFSLAGGASNTLYVVIWISETGASQTDSNAFSGVVSFTGYNSADKSVVGVTSTIRS